MTAGNDLPVRMVREIKDPEGKSNFYVVYTVDDPDVFGPVFTQRPDIAEIQLRQPRRKPTGFLGGFVDNTDKEPALLVYYVGNPNPTAWEQLDSQLTSLILDAAMLGIEQSLRTR